MRIDPQQNHSAGGDLLWYRHLGRADGSFAWEGPKKVGSGWGHFQRVVGAADGVLYAINDVGELLWYRHVGRDDGSFRWEGPKTVGTGWGGFSDVFGGADGVLYSVQPRVGPDVGIDPRWNALRNLN